MATLHSKAFPIYDSFSPVVTYIVPHTKCDFYQLIEIRTLYGAIKRIYLQLHWRKLKIQ